MRIKRGLIVSSFVLSIVGYIEIALGMNNTEPALDWPQTAVESEKVYLRVLYEELHRLKQKSIETMSIPHSFISNVDLLFETNESVINLYLVCMGARPAYALEGISCTDPSYAFSYLNSLGKEEFIDLLEEEILIGDQAQKYKKFKEIISEYKDCLVKFSLNNELYTYNGKPPNDGQIIFSRKLLSQVDINDGGSSHQNLGVILGYPYTWPGDEDSINRVVIEFSVKSHGEIPFLRFVCTVSQNSYMINEYMRASFERALQKVNPDWKVIVVEKKEEF